MSGTAAMPTGRGLGGAIVSGIDKGITGNRIGDLTMTSCMAEYGYQRMTPSEFEGRCPKPPPPAPPPKQVTRQKAQPKSAPAPTPEIAQQPR